jgi:hypothetical protein
VPGRRTITITGRGAERRVPASRHSRHEQRRPYVPRHERAGFRPDRTAAMAVALALLLVLVAAASSHGAVLRRAALPNAAGAPVARLHPGASRAAVRHGSVRQARRTDTFSASAAATRTTESAHLHRLR